MYTIWSYVIYLAVSIALTMWVGWTLFRNGRIFLVDTFHGHEALADSVNHLLLVGFYLINIGYVSVAMQYGERPLDVQQVFEVLSLKLGLVLIILGGIHFMNLYVFSRMRKSALLEKHLNGSRT
ncbi:MAG: hypothetical protein HY291_22545 [Planctomycetes bacterium]|nr:hypothetical protein [Planctomycetota bacterium]